MYDTHGKGASMRSKAVAVYNMGGEQLLHHVSLNQAMRNLLNGKYRITETIEGEHFGPFEMPSAVEVTEYIHTKWWFDATGEVPFSKRGVLRRDGYKCCYCGGHGDTVDHVLPKWRKNAASWTNSVAACFPCNNKKGGRSPEEAGMKMRFQPYTPTFGEAYRWTRGGKMPSGKAR